MAIDLTSVLGTPAPTDTTAPAAEVPALDQGGIPDAVLEIPEIYALLQGKPPAILTSRDDSSPEVQTVVQHAPQLQEAGLGFYGARNGTDVVLFNTQFLSPEQLQAADAKGKLLGLATPFADLKASLAPASGSPAAPEAPAAGAAPQMAASSPGAGFDKRLATKRMANLAVGSPTSGQAPGQGRILNSILSPVV